MKTTPEWIEKLDPNQVFVYGSNDTAKHGGGAAKQALKFGAVYGQAPTGLIGQTYGIITVSFNNQIITPEFIKAQIDCLYHFAIVRPDLEFLVTKIGTGLGGWPIETIAEMFQTIFIHKPSNIILPVEFI